MSSCPFLQLEGSAVDLMACVAQVLEQVDVSLRYLLNAQMLLPQKNPSVCAVDDFQTERTRSK